MLHVSFSRRWRVLAGRAAGIGLASVLLVGTAPVAAAANKARAEVTPKASRSEGDASGRTWVTHRVVPKERLDDIAIRYGVTRAELMRWNKKVLGGKEYLYAGRDLRVHARRVPPPREKTRYLVQRGDTWKGIADRFNIREDDLRHWNSKVPRSFRAGTELVVYTNPLEPPAPEAPADELARMDLPNVTAVARIEIQDGALSIGKPNRGRLMGGVQPPMNDLYTVRDPSKAWGASHTVEVLVNAIAKFRHRSGYEGELVIGAISKKGGGRFKPHKSHQSGRDIDIRLPRLPGAPRESTELDDVDWRAAWVLVESFIESGQAEYIFLEHTRQRRLYQAARAAGKSEDELKKILQYPARPKENPRALVKHAEGHTIHIHVRIKCAPDNRDCES